MTNKSRKKGSGFAQYIGFMKQGESCYENIQGSSLTALERNGVASANGNETPVITFIFGLVHSKRF